jgi:hypothetical protein
MGCDETKMNDWLIDVCDIRERDGKRVTEVLAEMARNILIH